MPCPHNEITIVQRSQRQSAVAAAAYQSGEKLFCEYDQQVKHYPEKRGIVHNEILLPANAPPEYADRNTLWNAADGKIADLYGCLTTVIEMDPFEFLEKIAFLLDNKPTHYPLMWELWLIMQSTFPKTVILSGP